MKYFIALVFVFLISSKASFSNTIEYIDVKAKGIGSSYTEALNNSLSNAIAQVNGRSIETQTSLKKFHNLLVPVKIALTIHQKSFKKPLKSKRKDMYQILKY